MLCGLWLAGFDPYLLLNNHKVLIYIHSLHSVSASNSLGGTRRQEIMRGPP